MAKQKKFVELLQDQFNLFGKIIKRPEEKGKKKKK